ncbi:MAG: hypothetical protein LBQ31_07300 [Bacteroidales bacterium]|jgi:hypothetical protein|nr:hypothetical protein [Bacteroidales bacterium]
MTKRYLRIHGDNIVECERTLLLLSQAFGKEVQLMPESSLYMPVYELVIDEEETLQIDLLAGHGRWGVDIATAIMNSGGVLREGADSYLTEIINGKEQILLAMEYCSALPAGNNAWQRNGRAYSSLLAGVPYLYYAEIGGVELDENRAVKAPRFPNPVVPFSYLTATKRMTVFCIPVYTAHPSITEVLNNKFQSIFGYSDSLEIVKGVILKTNFSKTITTLIQKALSLVTLLSNERRATDTLRNDEWANLLNTQSSGEWLKKNSSHLIWKKKTADKVMVSNTFRQLFASVLAFDCLTVGAKDLPICLIPTNKRKDFELLLKRLYPKMKFTFDPKKQLAIVWITGFKPRGDDSRPDRGLTPLARMVLGNDTDILTVVYGPAKQSTWQAFINSPAQIAKDNGLWQSILNVCDYVLVDSATCNDKLFYKTNSQRKENAAPIVFPYQKPDIAFSEHDTDSAIHLIFSRKEQFGIYESLCNPPGGDWSGISYFESGKNEYRWTSLPRVSAVGGKRPDHIIQLMGNTQNIFLSIESKQKGKDLEDNIGVNLKTYINDLFKDLPTAYRTATKDWRLFDKDKLNIKQYSIVSIGAFIYSNEADLHTQLQRGKLDIIFAFEFGRDTILHILSNASGNFIKDLLKQICAEINGVKIQIH